MTIAERNVGGKKQSNDRAVFNFIGRALRTNPNILDSLDPRDAYILLARSDVSVRRPSSELSEIFGVTPTRINQIFSRALNQVHRQSVLSGEPVPTLKKPAVSKDKGLRISEGMRAKYQDPKFKARVLGGVREARLRRARAQANGTENVYDIDPTDQELWEYVLVNDLKGVLVRREFLSESEVEMLSRYFGQEKGARNIESLLNRLSLALAKLA